MTDADRAVFESFVRNCWPGPETSLQPLVGELDRNYRVSRPSGRIIIKVMRPDCDPRDVDVQIRALQHLEGQAPDLPVPRVLLSATGKWIETCTDSQGRSRLVWAMTELPGRTLDDTRPVRGELLEEIGGTLARLQAALASFAPPELDQDRSDFKWDLRNAEWIRPHLSLVEKPLRERLERILDRFRDEFAAALQTGPVQTIHNDFNGQNLLVWSALDRTQKLTGVLDFGDAIRGPVLADVAIASAYLSLNRERPIEAVARFLSGFHRAFSPERSDLEASPLEASGSIGMRGPASRTTGSLDPETVWALACTRLAVTIVNAHVVAQEKPDDPYVFVSANPAREVLKRTEALPSPYINARIGRALRAPRTEQNSRTRAWVTRNSTTFARVCGGKLNDAPVLDLSVSGLHSPIDPLRPDLDEVQRAVESLRSSPSHPVLGRYGEPRMIYTHEAFYLGKDRGPRGGRRTVHLGIDVFLPAGTPVCAPLDGTVHSLEVRPARCDYGGLVTLSHQTEQGDTFFTLYGHLRPESFGNLRVGDLIPRGDAFALLGDESENGQWPPHLHFQWGMWDAPGGDWLGVADPDEASEWMEIFPDPAPLLGLESGAVTAPHRDSKETRRNRDRTLGPSLRLSYDEPVEFARGWGALLFDPLGRPYLDAYNNVPHVGHAHPRIREVAERQLRHLNTNTRYLHPIQAEYAEALTALLPNELEVCYFLNSASEANELALRLARAHTGGTDMIVSSSGYHGHTWAAVEMSHYKFAGPGGAGQADWVHVVPIPDGYRGPYGQDDPDAGPKFAAAAENVIARMTDDGRSLAGFLSEPFPSVGGQIIPPPGYLRSIYAHVRAAGGVCIADEVQTGLGRLGNTFWGFEQQGAEPDIVVLGKPIGNGHPLAAVVTTRDIANSFDNGMEFFSTFGGSTLSCAIGLEVLRILEDEQLPQNAEDVGAYLLEELRALAAPYPFVAEVRGMGFFFGIEIVEPPRHGTNFPSGSTPCRPLSPSAERASYIANRLRERRVLIGTDGPHHNVLKIRPPLCFSRPDADHLLSELGTILRTSTPLHSQPSC